MQFVAHTDLRSPKVWSRVQKEKAVKVFNSLKLINANTVEVLHKGALEFKVIHNFYDLGGSNGGVHHFFGLDNAADVKIVFQVGLTDKLNIVGGRTRGGACDRVGPRRRGRPACGPRERKDERPDRL